VAITGANSAVGRALLRRAATERETPLAFVAAVRSARAAADLGPLLGDGSRVVRIAYDNPESLDLALGEASAVVHLAGALVERPGTTYEEANVLTARRVAEAAARRGVKKLVLVSALGADAAATNRYWRTKGQAEALVRASGLPHAVLRVPLLLGRGTEGARALLRSARRPLALLPGGGRHLEQPLDVDDVARAALVAARPDIARDRTLELAGPVALPHRDLVRRAAERLGRRVRIVPIPLPLARLALAAARRVGATPFSPDALEVVTADTHVDPASAATELGLTLTGLDAMLDESLEPGSRE
jgi:NADH dehydrogenase